MQSFSVGVQDRQGQVGQALEHNCGIRCGHAQQTGMDSLFSPLKLSFEQTLRSQLTATYTAKYIGCLTPGKLGEEGGHLLNKICLYFLHHVFLEGIYFFKEVSRGYGDYFKAKNASFERYPYAKVCTLCTGLCV